MKKHIAEELPARKFPQAAAGDKEDKKGGKTPEKRVKQAIYDIRYRARREELPLQQAYSQYMSNSSMSQQEKTLVKQKLFGKGGMKAEDFNIGEFASDNVANALYKVFVEGVQKEEEPIVLTYMEKLETAEHRKYKVRVTGKDGRSYVRYATREKINDLRANPNIESVEMTGYGEPYEGEKKKGEQTARAKAGKGLDPVGKEDKDIDNDGDHDKSDKYLLNRRKARGAAIASRKTQKEEFIREADSEASNPDANNKQIKPMSGKNKVVINPPIPGASRNSAAVGTMMAHHEMEGPFIVEKAVSQAQQKFMGMVYAAKKGEKPASPEVAKAAAGMSKKEAKKFAKTKHKGLPVHKEAAEPKGGGSAPNVPASVYKFVDELPQKLQKTFGSAKTKPTKPVKEETVAQADKKAKKEQDEMDPRSIPTAMNLAKNKLRAIGLKCSYDLEGDQIDELNRLEREQGRKSGGNPDEAYRIVKKGIRKMEGKPEGQRKKVPGKKPPAAGEYGGPRSPAQKVAKRRAAAQRAQDNMSSRFD
jgi:hypothetical protein